MTSVSISAIALVPADELSEGDTPLLKVVEAGAPGFPLGLFGVITMFAVANSALINMLMASRLLYGMANQDVLPRALGKVLPGRRTPYVGIAFSTVLALGLLAVVLQRGLPVRGQRTRTNARTRKGPRKPIRK